MVLKCLKFYIITYFNSGNNKNANFPPIANKAKSSEPKQSMSSNKNIESSLNFKTIDPLKISKSSTTPKSQNKKIKPQISILKSAKKHQNNSAFL